MSTTHRLNRILLLWLLALGTLLAPARSSAACEMAPAPAAAVGHACCVQKAQCACELASTEHQALGAAQPTALHNYCGCVARPQPVSPNPPQVDPLRLYIVAALPTRAGPISVLTLPAPSFTAPLLPTVSQRFVPASPPRAPPIA